MKAEWLQYLDGKSNQFYERPCCPECSKKEYGPTPIVYKDGKYVCLNCCQVVDLDRKQQKWIDTHRRTRKKVEKCFMCDAYKMILTQRRDPITNKWVTSSGECGNCGCKMIV